MHERTTGQEIWRDTDGMGRYIRGQCRTGGTVSGVGAALKKQQPGYKDQPWSPKDSPVPVRWEAGPRRVQRIGAGFVLKNYNSAVVDGICRYPMMTLSRMPG